MCHRMKIFFFFGVPWENLGMLQSVPKVDWMSWAFEFGMAVTQKKNNQELLNETLKRDRVAKWISRCGESHVASGKKWLSLVATPAC